MPPQKRTRYGFVLLLSRAGSAFRLNPFDLRPKIPGSHVVPQSSNAGVALCATVWDVTTEKRVFQELSTLSGIDCQAVQLGTTFSDGGPDSGIRGLFASQPISEGDPILKISLEACLRDDQSPPIWFEQTAASDSKNQWAARLAAAYLELQRTKPKHPVFKLMPDADDLRERLPTHWDDDVVQSVQCQAFEKAVDNAFFTYHATKQQLFDGLRTMYDADWDDATLQRRIDNALDIVQTRSCRVEINGQPVRLLAPVFDMINHEHETRRTAEFVVVDNAFLGVRAWRDIGALEQITIDYGPSTLPAWRCLVSYGFVPPFNAFFSDQTEAEVHVLDHTYTVSTTSVPQDLVTAWTQGQNDGDDEELSAEVALQISSELADISARATTVDVTSVKSSDPLTTPQRLARALRAHQQATILACANGLRTYALLTPGADRNDEGGSG